MVLFKFIITTTLGADRHEQQENHTEIKWSL